MAFSSWRTWVTGEVVTAAHMNQEVRDNGLALFPDGATSNAWSPTLRGTTSDPSTSAVAGREYTVGPIQFCEVRWVLLTPGSGTYFVTLPSTASGLTASTDAGKGQIIGGFHMRDDSPPYMIAGSVLLRTSTTAFFNGESEIHANSGVLSHDNPRPWASGDVLSFQAWYFVA